MYALFWAFIQKVLPIYYISMIYVYVYVQWNNYLLKYVVYNKILQKNAGTIQICYRQRRNLHRLITEGEQQ